jgi:hypothetical protein
MHHHHSYLALQIAEDRRRDLQREFRAAEARALARRSQPSSLRRAVRLVRRVVPYPEA